MTDPTPIADAVGEFHFDMVLATADEPPEGWADWPFVRTTDPHINTEENH